MTDTPEHDDGQQVRPFAAILEEINGGDFADQLAQDVQHLTTEVRDKGRKGKLTITVEIAPLRGNATAFTLAARRELRLPQEEPMEAVFFGTKDGNLVREDPRQMALPLRTVNRPEATGDLKRAGQ